MKPSIYTRLLCAAMALFMLTALLACGKSRDGSEQNTTTAPQGADTASGTSSDTSADAITENTDANGYLKDQLPDELDYGGKTVTMLTWEDVEHEEFFVDEITGDVVGDAIYNRTLTVEERLGIRFQEITCKANASNISTWTTYVTNENMSGSHAYDIMAAYSQSMASTAAKGLCYDLLDANCPYLNFENPWWSGLLVEQASINGKMPFCSGDISINALYMMYVCFVNDGIIEEYKLDSPSQLVLDSKWTFDRFFEMCSGIYSDLNGNGIKDQGDQFAYYTYSLNNDPWFYASGAMMVDKDAEGHLTVSDTLVGEKVVNTLERLNSLLFGGNDGFTNSKGYVNEFRDGHVLFATTRARNSFKDFAQMEDLDYSIVPCPKYDEEQEEYYSILGVPFTLYALPSDCLDASMGSAVLECLASESYRQTTPAAFEVTLKTKYVRDEVDAVMYDIIRDSLTYDIGRLYASALIGVSVWRTAVDSNQTNWASRIQMYITPLNKKLASLESAFTD